MGTVSARTQSEVAGVTPSQNEKAETFRALHTGGVFVMPNAWDAGSARVLAALGFPALASTSSGFAFTLGRRDGGATLPEVLAHARLLDRASDLPVSVDLENGYGSRPEDAARAIREVAAAGAVGASIEDYDRDGDAIYPAAFAAERVAAAVQAARGLDFAFTLTARAENLLHGIQDLDDTIARLRAYAEAGADVLFAPGLAAVEQIRAVCQAVDRPVNVLGRRGLTVAQIVEAGARRISVGGALTWVAVDAMMSAARRIRDDGDFSAFVDPSTISGLLAG
jgi:2-methylisocitrate lyase-like PEP mutase family enzyme